VYPGPTRDNNPQHIFRKHYLFYSEKRGTASIATCLSIPSRATGSLYLFSRVGRTIGLCMSAWVCLPSLKLPPSLKLRRDKSARPACSAENRHRFAIISKAGHHARYARPQDEAGGPYRPSLGDRGLRRAQSWAALQFATLIRTRN
jgi:hypothetical protein